jgi:hypothetical protein
MAQKVNPMDKGHLQVYYAVLLLTSNGNQPVHNCLQRKQNILYQPSSSSPMRAVAFEIFRLVTGIDPCQTAKHKVLALLHSFFDAAQEVLRKVRYSTTMTWWFPSQIVRFVAVLCNRNMWRLLHRLSIGSAVRSVHWLHAL